MVRVSLLGLTMSEEDDTIVHYARWVTMDGILGKLKWGFFILIPLIGWIKEG